MEVPEIFDGTVSIKGAVREGGDRAKVAVHSVEPDVDPVGACVGMRGARVQSVIRELRGEKIDIVQWDADFEQYSINSLKPARVNRVTMTDGDSRRLEVVVDEDQLSLAIGKRGQNVRLAGKLLNATIDIKSEEDKKRDVEQALVQMAAREEALEALKGVGPKTAEALLAAGVRTVGEAIDAGTDGLLAVDGIGPKAAEKILGAAEELFASLIPDEPEVQEVVVDDSLTGAAADSVLASLSVDIETDEAAAADDIAIEAGVGAEVEAVAASDGKDEILAPTDTDEEEVVETSA
jgi:N utilization substance protein A